MANLLEEQIVEKIGMEETLEKYFSNEVEVSEEGEEESIAISFYTYENNLYINDSHGMDVAFSDFDKESQDLIHSEIMNGNYE